MGWMPLEEDAKEILESCSGVAELRSVELAGAAELSLALIGSADFEDTHCEAAGTERLDDCSEDSNKLVVVTTDSCVALEGSVVAKQYAYTPGYTGFRCSARRPILNSQCLNTFSLHVSQ